MKIVYTVLDATKAGNQPSEMEDAAWPADNLELSCSSFSCAVADGATQGSHSGPWARFLCEELTQAADSSSVDLIVDQVVPAARQRFQAWEQSYLEGRAQGGRPLQWFEEAVIGTGAYATLLGIRLEAAEVEGEGASFKAVAIGDSCLFLVHQQQVLSSFPLSESAQFAGAPLLIASQAAHNQNMRGGLHVLEGRLAIGDSAILCTDALAAWILREKESGQDPLARLRAATTGADRASFQEFLGDLRREKRLRNDDVTFVHIELKA